jgi:hypothetical protein
VAAPVIDSSEDAGSLATVVDAIRDRSIVAAIRRNAPHATRAVASATPEYAAPEVDDETAPKPKEDSNENVVSMMA